MRGPLHGLLELVAPRRCLGCDSVSQRSFCAECGPPVTVPSELSVLDGVAVLSAGAYSGSLAAAVKRFKYGRRPDMAKPLADLLAPGAQALEGGPLVWVPVPLHPERLAERGFNQSGLLARCLAHQTAGTFAPRVLVRAERTAQQAALLRGDREQNVEGVFRVRDTSPASVVLVDDVVTSGATARACIRALASRDITVGAVVALARALPAPLQASAVEQTAARGRR